MKNVVLKTCLTSLVLSMSGLAAANTSGNNIVTVFEDTYGTYSVIAGGALSVAAESTVTGSVAAQAAVTIGAETKLGTYNTRSNVFSGAAVTISAGAVVGNIYAAAAAGVAANAEVGNIKVGAAVTLGAPSRALDIEAGAAITLGAGSTAEDVDAAAATTGATLRTYANDLEIGGNVNSINYAVSTNNPHIPNIEEMVAFEISDALKAITAAQLALSELYTTANSPAHILGTSMGNGTILEAGVYEGSALTMPADTTITFNGDAVINLSDALTLGANTIIVSDGHSIIWNVGSALNLGAGTQFAGTAFVNGSVSGATSDICGGGSLYAAGTVAIGSIVEQCD
jgi:hypothetical protein